MNTLSNFTLLRLEPGLGKPQLSRDGLWVSCGSINKQPDPDKMSVLLCRCGGNASSFYQLTSSCYNDDNVDKKKYYWAAGLNFALFGVCLFSFLLTTFKFNSIHVLNVRYRPSAISNVLWVFFFMFLGIRSLLLALFYIDANKAFKYDEQVFPKVLLPTENIFKILQIMFMALSLEYQRKHRSKGFVQDIMERFNRPSYEESNRPMKLKCKKLLFSIYSVFIGQALLCGVFLAATCVFVLSEKFNSKVTAALYWTYHGFLWSLCVSCVALTVIIVISTGTDTHDQISDSYGPSKPTKLLIVFGVGFTLPYNIPIFIWQHCIFTDSSLLGYYITLPLMCVAVILFLAVLIQEFLRLKEEAHWNAIDQTEAQYSITESM